ncbi:hypothetical protein A0130_08160 [Leifsonia xyli]|uniref:exosortase/archaeosortase family protein n=1 Tax=Leifsonia xyli TaxID=1575 RepID=UPI0007CD9EF8|nr:hypothetical protein A0130_08160 [Leifsonia xyli]
MTTATTDLTAPRPAGKQRWFTPIRALRLLIAAALAAVVAGLIVFGYATRVAEAWIASTVANLFMDGGASPLQDSIFFPSADGPYHVALQVTEQCAVYVLLAPFLLLMAVMLGFTRVSWRRWAGATIVGAVFLVVVNMLRLVFIAFSTRTWGLHPGYELSHGVLGSAFGIIGFAVASVVALMVLSPRKQRQARKLAKAAARESAREGEER